MKSTLSTILRNEWHPTKNGTLTPDDISAGSGKKVWWLGSCSHEWEQQIASRSNGRGCPVCAGKIVVPGFNDIASVRPDLLEEWDYFLNGKLLPGDLTAGSKKQVIWSCKTYGHKWISPVYSRIKGSGCPYCGNKAVLQGFNDFASSYPNLLGEWSVNNRTSPQSITSGSGYHAEWICSICSHIWKTAVSHRANGSGCPRCGVLRSSSAQAKPKIGINDLATLRPDIAKQWSYKNTLTASDVSVKSHKKVWWKCDKGHEWEAIVSSRVVGRNCPVCSNRLIIKETNDFFTLHPDLSKEWHESKNNIETSKLSTASLIPFWWLGDCGHEWKASINSRVKGSSCPICMNKRRAINQATPISGSTDFATLFPQLCKEWMQRNKFTPESVKAGSKRKVWWKCDKGHEWEAIVKDRSRGSSCPFCVLGRQSSQSESEIFDFLKANTTLSLERRNKTVLRRKEIDIYIPDRNFGIEFNGVYWHSEARGKARNYHYDKWLAAKQAGIQLVQIWEDEWKLRRPIVERMLLHKLGISTDEKVFARKTHINILDTIESRIFLNQNHIQGFASGSYYISLKNNAGTVVAVMVLKKEPNNILNIIRYATSANVVGGFTKLLSFAMKAYVPDSFVTFADHTVSDGGLYENNGFVVDKELPPDYMYVYRNERKHKFGYRLKRFRNDPELKYVDGMTERELAQLNGLDRIWDAGKTKYVLKT